MTYFNEAKQKAREMYYPPPKKRKLKTRNMKVKIKAPPKVNAGDVTSMLKLISKNGYSTKMSNLLNFLNQTASIRTGAEVVATGLNIQQCGNVISFEELRRDFINDKMSRVRFHVEEEKALHNKLSEVYGQMRQQNDIIRLKKYKEDKKEIARLKLPELEKEKKWLGTSLKHLQMRIEWLKDDERKRLEATDFTIQEIREKFELYEGCKIRVDLQTGSYTFPVPTGTPFYREVCTILGLPLENQEAAEKPVIKKMFSMPSELIQALKKGLKFVSGDDLRPAMTGVLLEINNGKAQVVATDAHRLYMSQLFDVEGPPDTHEYIIPAKAINRLPKSIEGTFYFYEFKDGTVKMPDMNGQPIIPIDARFPDWKVVVPKYEGGVTFERWDMIASVKSVLPYCNKSTSAININFNGCIEFAAQDVDFSFEGGIRMRYLKKEMEDLLISFNGKFLVDALKSFDSDEIIFQGETATKAGILTDGADVVLIMPLMLSQ